MKNGRTSSVANWNYDVTSIPHHELKVGVPKDWNGSDVPNVTLIQDYDSDKMYLAEGAGRAMVLDAGYFDARTRQICTRPHERSSAQASRSTLSSVTRIRITCR